PKVLEWEIPGSGSLWRRGWRLLLRRGIGAGLFGLLLLLDGAAAGPNGFHGFAVFVHDHDSPRGRGDLGIDPLGYPGPAGENDVTCVSIVIGFCRDANIVLRLFA